MVEVPFWANYIDALPVPPARPNSDDRRKGLRKSLLSSGSSIRNSILVKKGYKAVNELTLVGQKRSVLIYRELFEREEKPGRIEIDRYEARGKVVRKIGARRPVDRNWRRGGKTNLFDEIPRTNSEKEMGQWDRILEKYPRC